jgi:uncharacterized repeat protein (TIGR01451 family)
LWLACNGALGAEPPERLPNLDKRRDSIPAARPLPAEKLAAFAEFKALLPDARVDWDPLLETPKFIRASHGFLLGANDRTAPARAVVGARPDRHEPARRFLARHSDVFGHGPEALDAAKIKREFVTPHNGLRTTVWEQQLDGIPVFQAVLVAHITGRGELAALSSQFVADPAQAADRGTVQRQALRAAPAITPAVAVVLAAQNTGETVPVQQVRAVSELTDAASGHHQFAAPGLRGPADATLVWLPLDPSRLRLCWQVIFTSRSRGEMFLLLVDARSGEIWVRHGLTESLSEATYRVFTSDSPSPFSPGLSMPLSTQPPTVPRASVTLGAISTNASPAGWITDGDNETAGNNVDAHRDWDGDDMPDLPRPQGSPFRVFEFPLDLEQDPRQSSDAAVVQLFYLCNWMHDRLYDLGFTEAAGNFQRLNFGRGGLEGDPVMADAQDGRGVNNAVFSSPPDGTPGRMEMFLWDGPVPRRDAAFDAEVVLHEYTHGLSNRRVGGGTGLDSLQSRGLGEGWSDFYALTLLSEPGDDPNATYAAGAYASYQLGGLQENYYYGIRRYPYSTDLSKNPLTFKDLDPTVASLHQGVPRNPVLSGDPAEVHHQGELWCVTLWEARANLIARWGFETGNELILRLVTDGLNLTPPNPDFIEARDAILLADIVNNQGANFHELWQAFAKRGMGASSSAPPSSMTIGIQEAFDLPDQLVVVRPPTIEFRGPVGGPFVPERQSYQVWNLGTNQLNWLAAQSSKWLSLALSRTNLAAGAPPGLVEVFLNPFANQLGLGLYREFITFTNLTSGRTQSFPVTLRVYPLDYFTEEFSDRPVDLDFQTLTFTPNGSTSFYAVCRSDASGFPSDPIGGNVLGLSDDSFVQITLADGKEVSMYGRSTNTLYVGSNGYLSFDGGDAVFEATLSRHFDRPRIAGLFDDLDPQAGGTVSWRQWPDRVAITFQDVPEYSQTNRNSFQMEMFFDGALRVTWLEIAATKGIVGLSRGEGLSAGFVESDLSTTLRCPSVPALLVPAAAREGDGLLAGRGNLVLSAATNVDLVFSLASSDPHEVLLPSSVSIRAGTTNAIFDLLIVDDDLLDLTQPVYLSAHGENGESAYALMEVLDNETGKLSVNLPPSAVEGTSFEGTVTASVAAVSEIAVNLISSNTNEIQVPPEVFIPAGQTTATFVATLPDNRLIDGTRAAGVTARVPGWTDGNASIEVMDNESRTLTLQVPAEANEGDGTLANGGSVEIAGPMAEDLLVVLFSVDDSEIKVPNSVIIPAGQTNATFDITVVDDTSVDGTQRATLYAFAVDFRQGMGAIAVHDNEPVRLTLSIPPEITEGDPVTQATLDVSTAPANDVVVNLSSSDPSQLQVPLTIKIPAGQRTVNFPLAVLDDAWLDGPQPVIVTALVKNWTPGSATVIARDNEPAVIEVTLPAETSETSGLLSGAGHLRLGGLTVTNRVVTLLSSDTNKLVVPEFVIVFAGQSNAVFDLAFVDDPRSDGPVRVAVTAQSEGLANGQATVIVRDNEVHGFVFGEISSPQTAGVPFLVSVTAVDIATNRITGFTNAVALRAAGPEGPLPALPTHTGAFISGVWTGAITLSVASPNVRLVAEDGLEHAGNSRAIEVLPGPLDHFEWNPISSPQRAGLPFLATLVARDAFGNAATGFDEVVTLGALISGVPAEATFSPAGLSNFVSGAWHGALVVQEPTASLEIRAVDRFGHAGLANRLDVIRADDVALSSTGPAAPVAISNVFSFILTITNTGPGEASAVVVSNVVPSEAAFVSALPSQGTCTNQEGILICDLGALADSAHATIGVTLQAVFPGTMTNTAFVHRGEPDASESNNVARLLTRVTNPPPVIELVRPVARERFFGPTNLLLEAQASDSEGVVKVEFFEGTNKLGEVSASPYVFLWEDVLPGQYTLTAIASDSLDAVTVSLPVAISVGDAATNAAPQILAVSPLPGSPFNAASNGLSFTARTASPNFIPTDSIRLVLNGVEVTLSLALSGDPQNRAGRFDGLVPDTIYSARLIVADDSSRATTQEWSFDTFDITRGVVIEAEDYNYSDSVCSNGVLSAAATHGGLFQDNPPPSGFTTNGTQVNGNGIGFLGLAGLPGVDFSAGATNIPEQPDRAFRPCDGVGTRVATNEFLRLQYEEAGVEDYAVTQLRAGDWLNYTRTFTQRDYVVYLRAASIVPQELRLGLVGGDPTTTNQTESLLGTFVVPQAGDHDFAYAPLTETDGQLAVVRLPGLQTFRLTALTADSDLELNYLVFIPIQRTVPPAIAGLVPVPNSSNVPPDAIVEVGIINGDFPVDTNSVALQINGDAVTPEFTPTAEGLLVRYRPNPLLQPNGVYSVQFAFRDTATSANAINTNWSFTVANLPVLPGSLAAPSGSGGARGFLGRIHKARNDAPPELFVGSSGSSNTAARAELQLDGRLIDPLTSLAFSNEAAGPDGDGSFVLDGLVNFDQNGRDAGLFSGDISFPWVTGDDPDFMAMELRAYLELTSGVYRFGVSHDEGFQLSVGARAAAPEIILGRFEGTYDHLTPIVPEEFEFVVLTNGLYGFRLLWWEGQGPAQLEWYSRDRQTGERRLISDAGGIAAYQFRVVPPSISILEPVRDAVFGAPADIAITAGAAENGEPAEAVVFFAGEQRVGSAAMSPFGILWTNVPSGSYLLTAVMTNHSGNTVTSAPVRIVVNASPILSAIPDQTARENTPIPAIAFSVSDLETPASDLVVAAFSSNTNLLPDANILFDGTTTNRTVTLRPQTNQFGSAVVRMVVSDGLTNARVSFTLTIIAANSAPTLDPIADRTIDEGQPLSLTAVASDPDQPVQSLTFSWGAEPPMGATINATNGLVTWTPDEAQGPGTYAFVVLVTDDASSPRSATQHFAVTVNEVNRAPVLEPVGHQTVRVGTTLVVTSIATDPDLPANRLVFNLGPGAPAGSAIDPVTGQLTWTVPAEGEAGTNSFTVRVTDDGTPPLSAETSFTVGVVVPLQIEAVALTDQGVALTWRASPGQTYQVEYKTDLRKPAWNTFPIAIVTTNHLATFVDTLGAGPLKFYRIVETR